MAAWVCLSCTAVYAVGLAACPQCGAIDHEEDSMPKISKGDGPSYEPGHSPAGDVLDVADAEPAGDPEPAAPGADPDPEPAPAPKK